MDLIDELIFRHPVEGCATQGRAPHHRTKNRSRRIARAGSHRPRRASGSSAYDRSGNPRRHAGGYGFWSLVQRIGERASFGFLKGGNTRGAVLHLPPDNSVGSAGVVRINVPAAPYPCEVFRELIGNGIVNAFGKQSYAARKSASVLVADVLRRDGIFRIGGVVLPGRHFRRVLPQRSAEALRELLIGHVRGFLRMGRPGQFVVGQMIILREKFAYAGEFQHIFSVVALHTGKGEKFSR